MTWLASRHGAEPASQTVGMVDRPRLSLAADGDEAAFVQTPLALFLTTAHSLLSSPW